MNSDTVVTAFGRFNPPTVGHSLLLHKINDVAKQIHGDAVLFMSQSQDPKKNPIPYDLKTKFVQQIADGLGLDILVYTDHDVKHAIAVLEKVSNEGYKNLVFIAGSDRIPEYETLFNKYNGKNFNFADIKIISAGERDPDSDDELSSMSASKMRGFAQAGDVESFAKGIDSDDENLIMQIWQATRAGLGLQESINEASYANIAKAFQDPDRLIRFYRQVLNGQLSWDALITGTKLSRDDWANLREIVNGALKSNHPKKMEYVKAIKSFNEFLKKAKMFKELEIFQTTGLEDIGTLYQRANF